MKGSRLRRKLLTAATLVIAVVVSFSVVPPQPVSAAETDGYCENNEVCVYMNANFVTPRSDFTYYYPDMDGGFDFHTYNYPSSCNEFPGAWNCRRNDTISSVQNLSDHRSVCIFTDAYYDGNFQKIGIYGSASQVTYNDQTSSECWNDGGITYAEDPDCTFSN